jgi:hypothetical protein
MPKTLQQAYEVLYEGQGDWKSRRADVWDGACISERIIRGHQCNEASHGVGGSHYSRQDKKRLNFHMFTQYSESISELVPSWIRFPTKPPLQFIRSRSLSWSWSWSWSWLWLWSRSRSRSRSLGSIWGSPGKGTTGRGSAAGFLAKQNEFYELECECTGGWGLLPVQEMH